MFLASLLASVAVVAAPLPPRSIRKPSLGGAVVAAPQVRIADLPIFQVIGFKTDELAVILGLDMLAGCRLVIDHPDGRLFISEPVVAGAGEAQ